MKREVQIILTADEGMVLTNGDGAVHQIRLPEGADETVWREITEKEYNATVAEETEEVV